MADSHFQPVAPRLGGVTASQPAVVHTLYILFAMTRLGISYILYL